MSVETNYGTYAEILAWLDEVRPEGRKWTLEEYARMRDLDGYLRALLDTDVWPHQIEMVRGVWPRHPRGL